MQGEIRVGLGHDIHRLAPGRPFILGGLEIPFERGPLGHSDGDVLLHALTDALLGAAGLGDIGEWFPDNDPQWKGVDSALFVRETFARVTQRGWKLVNVDATVWVEQPKLKPHKPAIRQRLAELLGHPVESVNVKAKSGEAVGPVGRGEAVMADVIVLLQRHAPEKGD